MTSTPAWVTKVRELTAQIEEHARRSHELALEKKAVLQEQSDTGMRLSDIARAIGVSRERVSIILRPKKESE